MALTFIGSASSSTNATSYDFGNFTALTNGLLIVLALTSGGSADIIASVSIGGVNGALRVNPSGGIDASCVATRAVSAGSHNVTVTRALSAARASVHVWLLTGYSSEIPAATVGLNNGSSGTSAILSLNIPANGVAVFGVFHDNNNGTSWSSAVSQGDLSVETRRHAGADKSTVNALLPHMETASWTTSARYAFVAASWAPTSLPIFHRPLRFTRRST